MKRRVFHGSLILIAVTCMVVFSPLCQAHSRVHFYFDPWFFFWYPVPISIQVNPLEYGQLDLDVVPEDAEVFIDGKNMGICDQFDGFPDYLHLKAGHYLITFKKAGYLTYERQIEVIAGRELEFNTRLQKDTGYSHSTPVGKNPEVFTYEQTDARKNDPSKEKEASGSNPKDNRPGENPPPAESGQTGRDSAIQTAESAPAESPGSTAVAQTPNRDRGGESAGSGVIKFRIFPKDATIYLDKKAIGTAGILNESPAGIQVSAGEHTVDMVMPGFAPASQVIYVKTGETSNVRVILTEKEE
jgi:hypothetical protein